MEDGLGREAPDVVQPSAYPERAENSERQPVCVEERKALDEHVSGCPVPDACERVEVRADRTAGEDDPFRRSGRPRRIQHESSRSLRRLVGERIPMDRKIHRHPCELSRAGGKLHPVCAEHRRGPAVADDVRELVLTDLRVDRDHGDASSQTAKHGDTGLERGFRPDCHALHSGDLASNARDGARELRVCERPSLDPQRLPTRRIAQGGEETARHAGESNVGRST